MQLRSAYDRELLRLAVPALGAAVALLAEPIVELVGVEGRTADYAVTYLRLVSIGVPSFFLALGGQGASAAAQLLF